jgi:LytS/YehU family sensor histidine kinase
MIARLGDFLRLTLEQSDEQLVSLKNEMEFLRCYLDIEQVRFGERLTVNFAIEPAALGAQVPHLILQPVVENAIQHAIAPRAAPGRIDIEAKRRGRTLVILVGDSGPGIARENGSLHGHGVGLANVQARLRQVYDGDFTFELTNNVEGGLSVLLQMPVRTNMSDQPEDSR